MTLTVLSQGHRTVKDPKNCQFVVYIFYVILGNSAFESLLGLRGLFKNYEEGSFSEQGWVTMYQISKVCAQLFWQEI